MMENNTHCKACGERIRNDQKIMSTLKGAYHSDNEGCRKTAYLEAPVW